jgi:hypothetical protein
MSEASCNLCEDRDNPFTVPWSGTTAADNISAEIMKEHLWKEHGVEKFKL